MRKSMTLHLPLKILISASLWLVFSSLTRGSVVSSVGPIRLNPREGAFAWRASVNRKSGHASSKEASVAPRNSPLMKLVSRHESDDLVSDLANALFTEYASWLSRLSVTMGLFKTGHVREGFELRTKLFGVNLLTFGKASSTNISVETRTRQGHTIKSSQCTVSIPIRGGLLSALSSDGQRWAQSTSPGTLLFTMRLRRIAGKKESQERQRVAKNSEESVSSCTIVTEIVDYRPMLTGTPPVSPFRARIYLSTQSLFHAYVMWRLHRKCWSFPHNQLEEKEIISLTAR